MALKNRMRIVGAAASALAATTMAFVVPSDSFASVPLTRVSVSSSGAESDGDSHAPAMSGDGRFVAFTSAAQNLVAETTTSGTDVFVRDRQLGTTRLVSAAGSPANGPSHTPSMSTDGRYVAFISSADNLVDGDTNAAADVFVKDLESGDVARVSLAGWEQIPQGASTGPNAAQISGNGRFVIFNTAATLDSADIAPGGDIYIRSLVTGEVELVSHGFDKYDDGVNGANGYNAMVSADGRYVAYRAWTSPSVSPGYPVTAWLRDTVTDTSVDLIAQAGFDASDDQSHAVAISADGRYVAFETDAWGRPDDPTEDDDIWLYDTSSTTFSRITPAHGVPIYGLFPSSIALSGDGRVVVYQGGGEEGIATWAHDRVTGMTIKVTDNPVDQRFQGGGAAAVSATGDVFAFVSAGPLGPGDTNGALDVFVRSMPDCTITGTDGDDILTGSAGDDIICGMGGNDTLRGRFGNDMLIGGAGNDTADFSAGPAVVVDLQAGVASGEGHDTFTTVENVNGSKYADRIYGDGEHNALIAGGGTDMIDGRDGDDVLRGGGGADRMEAGIGNDSLVGGTGRDTVTFAFPTYADLALGRAHGTWFDTGTDSLDNVEDLIGSSGDDELRGNNSGNKLDGGGGTDALYGLGGADELLGGSGDDALSGGQGRDTCDGGDGIDTAITCERQMAVP